MDRLGLSNPYDRRSAPRETRPRTGVARAAVLVGMSGAAAVGLGAAGGSSAWAAPSTAVPVARYDGALCRPLHGPVLHADAGVLPVRRCGVPPAWLRLPLPADPGPAYPGPVDRWDGDPIDGAQLVSVNGTVEAGVEPGCVVLEGGDGHQWTLTGPLRTLPHDVPLTVSGITSPGTLSTCQQGEVLQVRQVRLFDPAERPAPAVPIVTTDQLAADARPVAVSPVDTDVEPACGPISIGKIPSVALCTR